MQAIQTEIWVPIIGAGTSEDPYRPDVPEGIAWSSDCGIPCDLEPDSPMRGHPLNDHALIRVAHADVERVPARLPEALVPAATVASVEIERACGKKRRCLKDRARLVHAALGRRPLRPRERERLLRQAAARVGSRRRPLRRGLRER